MQVWTRKRKIVDVEQNASDSREQKTSEPQAQGEMMMTSTLENAIARSISHTEIVHCEFVGEYSDLKAWLNDNVSVEVTLSEENDGSIDVAGYDWRVNVTLRD